MAEFKKEDSGGGGWTEDPVAIIIYLIIFAFILGLIVERLRAFWLHVGGVELGSPSSSGGILDFLSSKLASYAPLVGLISITLSGLFLTGIIYLVSAIGKIRATERVLIYPPEETLADDEVGSPVVNKKWERVLAHTNSVSSADWRLAIIEADIMLDELLDTLGYRGETMGDKLKAIEKSDFLTLDLAWEAHKVRNSIAHQGSDFTLSERETRRVIGLYEQVFQEFKYI